MLEKVYNALFYLAVGKEGYATIRPEIRQVNRKMTCVLSLVAAVLITAMAFISANPNSGIHQNRYVYYFGTAASILVCVLALTKARTNDRLILPLMYLAYATYYLYGIFIGAITDPHGKTVTFIAMLVLMPILFVDRPIRTIGIATLFITIFIVICNFTKDPEVFNVDVIDAIIFGLLGATTGTVMNINKAKAFKTRIEYEDLNKVYMELSRIDELTHLNNKMAYEQDIKKIVFKDRIACIYIDINDLKLINDRNHNHADGDKCISTVAQQIIAFFGSQYSYRMGGDEFVVFCPEMSKKKALSTVSKMQTVLGKLGYSISVGVEENERPYSNLPLNDLKDIADKKMYVDKTRQKAAKAAKEAEEAATITKDR